MFAVGVVVDYYYYYLLQSQSACVRLLSCRTTCRIGLNELKLEAFFIYDYMEQFREYETTLADWIRSGDFVPLEDIAEGLEKMPEALLTLYSGSNCGVKLVKIDPNAQ